MLKGVPFKNGLERRIPVMHREPVPHILKKIGVQKSDGHHQPLLQGWVMNVKSAGSDRRQAPQVDKSQMHLTRVRRCNELCPESLPENFNLLHKWWYAAQISQNG